ncbi:MAG: hypothetical protein WAV41_00875 [Microgenomates group bacterium]
MRKPEILTVADHKFSKDKFGVGRTKKSVNPAEGEVIKESNLEIIFVGDGTMASSWLFNGLRRKNLSEGYQTVLIHNRDRVPHFPK